jgi:hypothetical protein
MLHSIRIMSRLIRCGLPLFLVVGLAAPSAPADGGGGTADHLVYPVGSSPYGLSYGEWSARHWEWFYSLPVDANPLFDTADGATGQSGRVWFLGGTFAPSEIAPNIFAGVADRAIEVPAGTSLFFPLVDAEASTLEGNGQTEAELAAAAEFFADLVDPDRLTLEIDGEPVSNLPDHRFDSPLFTFGPLPDNNVLEAQGYDAPAGATTPSVSDGYFAMVKPLPVGEHTIHFTSTLDASSVGGPIFLQDITYHITVVPRGQVGN